jgi:hypothetical protein
MLYVLRKGRCGANGENDAVVELLSHVFLRFAHLSNEEISSNLCNQTYAEFKSLLDENTT